MDRLLAELAQPGSASALAAKVGLARQKVNYHLRALERHGLVRRNGARGKVVPGPAILRFAHRDTGDSLAELATPALKTLAQLSGETVNLVASNAAFDTKFVATGSGANRGSFGIELVAPFDVVGTVISRKAAR